jgi:hypothetical protein
MMLDRRPMILQVAAWTLIQTLESQWTITSISRFHRWGASVVLQRWQIQCRRRRRRRSLESEATLATRSTGVWGGGPGASGWPKFEGRRRRLAFGWGLSKLPKWLPEHMTRVTTSDPMTSLWYLVQYATTHAEGQLLLLSKYVEVEKKRKNYSYKMY